MSAFLIKLKSKKQKPIMLEQAKHAVHLLWEMENSGNKRKQQKVSTEGSNNLSKTKDQITQNILTEHGRDVARKATKVLAEKAKDADKQTGAN